MAKDTEVSVFERHVEKGVLAICLLLFLYSLFHWVSSSPIMVKVPSPSGLGEQVVPPPQADERLLLTAGNISKRIDATRVTVRRLSDWPAEFAKFRREPFASLSCYDLSMPRKALTSGLNGAGPTYKPPTLAEMRKVVPTPDKPVVWAGWELPKTENASDTLVGRVASVFPWGKLAVAWSEKLRNSRVSLRLVVIRVKVFRRERTPEGNWSEPKEIEGFRQPLVNRGGNPVPTPRIPKYNRGRNADKVRDAIAILSNPVWQRHILQPEYPDVYWPGGNQYVSWRWHLPAKVVSELAAATVTVSSKGVMPGAALEKRRHAPSSGRRRAPAPRARRRHPRRRHPRRPRPAGIPLGLGGEPSAGEFGPGGPGFSPFAPGRTPARRRRAPARRVRRHRPATGKPEKKKKGVPENISIPQLPTLEQQRAAGKVLIVVHDTGLESMKYYQYSVQLELVNPLLTYEKELATNHRRDALVPVITSPRSEWSEPVFIPTATQFFMAGSARDRNVTVRVFAQSLGQRVAATFDIVAGQVIGWPRFVKVNDPRTGKTIDRKVNFATGSVAVEVEYGRKVYVEGIRNFVAELLYLDAKGRLHTRNLESDRNSKRYRKLLAEVR